MLWKNKSTQFFHQGKKRKKHFLKRYFMLINLNQYSVPNCFEIPYAYLFQGKKIFKFKHLCWLIWIIFLSKTVLKYPMYILSQTYRHYIYKKILTYFFSDLFVFIPSGKGKISSWIRGWGILCGITNINHT